MILVTGVNGFVGKHLVRELSSMSLGVIGVGHIETHADHSIAGLLVDYIKCDVGSPEAVKNLPLSKVDCVINLAGLANAGASFENPELYMQVNVGVLGVLGKILLEASPKARMIAVSTGALYKSDQSMPPAEESATITTGSPYAMSKLAMEQAAQDLRSKGQDCVIVRPFNHIGPGQGPGFLIPDLVQKLRDADKNNPKISAGNLKTIRDYTDVRDIAKAYADLATAETLPHNLYNVCSGIGRSGEGVVKALCNSLGIDFERLTIEIDQSLIRPTDPQKIIGNNTRLQKDTGWSPSIPLDQTIEDIVKSL